MRMKLVYLLNDCVIDVKVAEVINSNKISNPQTERRPFCCVAEHLRVFNFPRGVNSQLIIELGDCI